MFGCTNHATMITNFSQSFINTCSKCFLTRLQVADTESLRDATLISCNDFVLDCLTAKSAKVCQAWVINLLWNTCTKVPDSDSNYNVTKYKFCSLSYISRDNWVIFFHYLPCISTSFLFSWMDGNDNSCRK